MRSRRCCWTSQSASLARRLSPEYAPFSTAGEPMHTRDITKRMLDQGCLAYFAGLTHTDPITGLPRPLHYRSPRGGSRHRNP